MAGELPGSDDRSPVNNNSRPLTVTPRFTECFECFVVLGGRYYHYPCFVNEETGVTMYFNLPKGRQLVNGKHHTPDFFTQNLCSS